MGHHMMGFKPDLDGIVLRPQLLRGLDTMNLRFTVRGSRVDVTVVRGSVAEARLDGRLLGMDDGAVKIPYPAKGKTIKVRMTVSS